MCTHSMTHMGRSEESVLPSTVWVPEIKHVTSLVASTFLHFAGPSFTGLNAQSRPLLEESILLLKLILCCNANSVPAGIFPIVFG